MKEQELVKLGFEKFEVSAEESGELPFHYYTYNFIKDDPYSLSLISNDNNKAEKEGWQVEIFDYTHVVFKDTKAISDFINIVKQNTIKE